MTGPEAFRMSKRMDAERAIKKVRDARSDGHLMLAGYMLGLLAAGEVAAVLAIENRGDSQVMNRG